MKKIFLVLIAIIMAALLTFTGCASISSDNSGKSNRILDYELLLQMPKSYVGITDNVEYESLTQFKEEVFAKRMIQGALATIECIDTVFYITIWHSDGDIMISGKAVTRCKVSDVGETFNGFALKTGSVVEFEQNYYIFPTDEEATSKMFESFGAVFSRDSSGAITGMEIEDGAYPMEIQDNVKYTLKLYDDTLPMEPEKKYTGAIISNDSKNAIEFLMPLEETDRYDEFHMSQSAMTVAAEIKADLSK